ncbi:hypothetical protein [Mycobacteroides abscessus]|uniref:hypothetical protein n=1 Tax=Mycobacteroides abscessus TaxID=36809 RepID=UPI0009A5CABA|nr:hypothetical protein [Mycobacteroides abscessus]MDO3233678.1 hypothetical protein [Mycobacteroides abscessus subsp. abscessus]SLI14141.1 Uncharacterised protein [Mycobacteroides abscessus subsp. massiliense]SLI23443.1 Uncharacterised protein [Mycobacteroides abscessus subsp. massiliense]SLK59175.1 Uncharacterised protein [Mycobacteroides abscessus subsp. abscessus]
MQHNEFNRVIDQIDALVDEQMAGGEYAAISRAEAVVTGVDRCALCGGDWHGSPWTGVDRDHLGEYDQHNHGRSVGCPGAFATGPQRIRYRWRKRQRSAMREWMGRGQDPLQRCLRTIQNMYDFMELLTGEQPAPWQREQLASWFNGTVPDLPPEFQFPRPIRFPPPMGPRGAEATFEVLDEAYTIDPAATSAPLPKLFMVPARGGQQSITRLRPDGRALLRYWGSPQVSGRWWELDPAEMPWADLEITHEQDRPPLGRTGRDRSLPPFQRVFIELTTVSGLHANPIGLIAIGHGNPGASGTVRRAYLKSIGDHPPLLYGGDRLTSSWQPTLWVLLGDGRMNPEQLVRTMREVEHL